ncbi:MULTISPECIES: alpha/beta fold hydrolase [Kitasatospora]|uniref:Putative peptidase S33 family protein n=1 Tax=Kitasatospora setae (strain ATCC 33774 / DSM 43861 / JCM 3304 / KCC A-0304 / NBRC 14216 / KM-6054) TaxID=452652 RepID=E4N100_KITSK|nr:MULTISPECIES: alpha/beta fold hydrolase [Kitasatospora]BAJ31834.1 putative peptidase S33 family protein [Kitasatospora setae KM-6054]
MRISEFRNTRAADRFQAAYDRALTTLWPGPRTPRDVPTDYGTTRVLQTGPVAGDAAGPPLVLLPGSGGNALMWHHQLGELARHRRVFAVDPVGEPGASRQSAPIADGRDAAHWLDQVLAGLDLTGAHLVGCSYGGWVALRHRLHHPGRAGALTLLDPAGFNGFGPRFYGWLIAGGMAASAPRALRPRLARALGNGAVLEAELMRLGRAATGFRRALPVPPVFTDEEVRRLDGPALFLLGARSALHDSRAVADRIARLLPAVRVEVVPDAGHSLPIDRPGLVADRILRTG